MVRKRSLDSSTRVCGQQLHRQEFACRHSFLLVEGQPPAMFGRGWWGILWGVRDTDRRVTGLDRIPDGSEFNVGAVKYEHLSYLFNSRPTVVGAGTNNLRPGLVHVRSWLTRMMALAAKRRNRCAR